VAQTSLGAGNVTWCKADCALFYDGPSKLASPEFMFADVCTDRSDPSLKTDMQSELPCGLRKFRYGAQLMYSLDRNFGWIGLSLLCATS